MSRAGIIPLIIPLIVPLITAWTRAGEAEPAGGDEALAAFRRGQDLFDAAVRWRDENPTDRAGVSDRFRGAAEMFVTASRKGLLTSAVLTNAANAYYFAGDTAEAVLHYRRACAADATNRSAQEALSRLREELPIKRRSSGLTGLTDALFFWHDETSALWRRRGFYLLFPAAWLLFGVEAARRRWPGIRHVLVPLLPLYLLSLALGYLFRIRRPYATVGVLCLLPALVLLGSLVADAARDRPGADVVVLVEVAGRNGDGTQYSPSHSRPLPPGTEGRVIEKRHHEGADETWLRVELLDGSTTWLPAGTVEAVDSWRLPAR